MNEVSQRPLTSAVARWRRRRLPSCDVDARLVDITAPLRRAPKAVRRDGRKHLGFARVELEPGQVADVELRIPTTQLAFTGIDLRRVVEPGTVDVSLGTSCVELVATATVELKTLVGRATEERIRQRAVSYEHENDALIIDEPASITVVDEGAAVYLEADLPSSFDTLVLGPVTGSDLPPVRLAGADFEAPDGSPVSAEIDLLGHCKNLGAQYPAGPIATLSGGKSRVRIW